MHQPFALGLAALIVAFVPFVEGSQARPQPTSGLVFSPTVFTSGAGETIEAESAWLAVPESRTKIAGAVIRLPLVRFRSTSQNPGPPIIYLAGGPGASGIESAKQAIFPLLIALRARGDVIVFDQRGTGKAEPSLLLAGRLDLPTEALLDSEATRRQLVAKARGYAADIGSRGIDLSAYNTNENADDVNDLRIALGAAKMVIWGHSYGSHLGLAVLRRHGAAVDRAILSGINGPDQRWRYPNDLELLIERLDQRIGEFPKLRKQVPSLKLLVNGVLDRLEKNPVTVTVQGRPVIVGRKEVEVITALMSGELEFVLSLPLFFAQMRDGDFSRAAQLTLSTIKQRPADTAMRYAMHIASGVSKNRAAMIEQQRPSALFHNAINFPFDEPEFLAAWGIRDVGDEYREPVKSSVPTLFLSGELDGRTSITDADDVSRHFSRFQRIVVKSVAHDFYHLTPKVLAAMLDFLGGKQLPQSIELPLQLRGPDELALIRELRKMVIEKGVGAAVERLREIGNGSFPSHVSSYVAGTVGVGLWQQDGKRAEAIAILNAGVELYPSEPFLHERLADLYTLEGEKTRAVEHYRACLELSPLNRAAALKLRKIE